ncbi:hypothetical protein HYDPIDRAFT_94771, partial [Hydnomerulius pinastri MD-312]
GVELVLYFKSMHILLYHRGKRRKSDFFYMFFSSMMLFCVTVWVATQAIFGQEMWLLDRNYPGGPSEYWANYISAWYMDFGMTAVILLQLMTDGIMIYRCMILWQSYRVVVVPSILWVITLVLGVAVDWISGSPHGDFFAGLASQLGLAYYSISVFLNTTVTSIICYRTVNHGMKVKEQLGPEYAYAYFDVASIIIESVLPLTLSGIAFLISFGLQSATSMTFISVYFLLMCISPQMLILRVIMGRAWDRDTGWPNGTAIKFSPRVTNDGSRAMDESAAAIHLQVLSNVYYPGSQGKV